MIDMRSKPHLQFAKAARTLALAVLSIIDAIRPGDHKQTSVEREHLEDELWETLSCANCGRDLDEKKVYCNTFCSENAGLVRYIRRARNDGRADQPDVQEGIGAKLLMLAGGGYPKLERALTPDQRAAIFERDRNVCQLCAKPATQIDHIAGNSNDPSNLRAVCRRCNLDLAFANAKTVSAVDDPHAYDRITRLYEDLAFRVAVKFNVRLCDDPDSWDKLQRALLKHRRDNFDELLGLQDGEWEDVDGYVAHTMAKDD